MGKQQMIELIAYLAIGVTLPFQYAVQYYFYKNFLGFRSKVWKFFLGLLAISFIDLIVLKMNSEAIKIIIGNVSLLVILCLLCKENFILKLYAVIVQDAVSVIIALTFLIFDFSVLPKIYKIHMTFEQYLIVYFGVSVVSDLIRLTLLFIFLKCICSILRISNKQINTYQGLYLLVPCLASYSLAVFFYIIQKFRIDNKDYYLPDIFPKFYYILPLISICLLIALLITAYTFNKMLDGEEEKRKKLLAQQQFELQLKHTQNIEGMYGGIRSVMHDMNNHLCCLKNLADTNNIEEIKKYFNNVSETISKLDFKIKTGNAVSDAVINEKYNIAKAENINFVCDFIIPKEISIEPADLCVILSNVLDNAIEACRKIEDDNIKKEILIKSFVKNMYLIIEVSNTKKNMLKYYENKIVSTKEDMYNHGIGISNIESTVKWYNGITDIVEGKDKFTINIMMPL